MTIEPKKYVIVLAHSDGWGARSANRLIRHLNQEYPDLGVFLIVSQASKDELGQIKTKLEDLKILREIKETLLLKFFERIDAIYDAMLPEDVVRAHTPIVRRDENPMPHLSPEELTDYCIRLGATPVRRMLEEMYVTELTFNELAKRYCVDGQAHFLSTGGKPGGREAAAVIEQIEQHYGHGPEILLSVDTMAILPGSLLERFRCVSAHPGPLDDIRVAGMQGTLRSLVYRIFYGPDGKPLPKNQFFARANSFVKGTLFFQVSELDKGPPVEAVTAYAGFMMCGYHTRIALYDELIDAMEQRLPVLLDSQQRETLFAAAVARKEKLDAKPFKAILDLEESDLVTWEKDGIIIPDETQPWGYRVFQNKVLDADYFKDQMRLYYPGHPAEFENVFNEIFGDAMRRLEAQIDSHLTNALERLYAGKTNATITTFGPSNVIKTEFRNARNRAGQVVAVQKNHLGVKRPRWRPIPASYRKVVV